MAQWTRALVETQAAISRAVTTALEMAVSPSAATSAGLPTSAEDGETYYLEDSNIRVTARNLSGKLWWLPPAWAELPVITSTRLVNGTDNLTSLAAAGWTWDVGGGSISNAVDGLGGIRISGDVNTRVHMPVPSQSRVIYLGYLNPVSETGGGRAWFQAVNNPVGRRLDVFGPNTTTALVQRTNSSATMIGTAVPSTGVVCVFVGWDSASSRSGVWGASPYTSGRPPDFAMETRANLESTSASTRAWWIAAYTGRNATYHLRAVAALDATSL